MRNISILIIEDELIIAEDIRLMLLELEYHVLGIARDTKSAFELLNQEVPDLALIDIQLRKKENGIDLGNEIKKKYGIPVIFVTSHSDKNTLNKAKLVNPSGFIVKPFEKADLFTSIEIALFNFSTQNNASNCVQDNVVLKDSIFIRKDYMLVKIKFDDLKWIRSDDNYLELYCAENKHLIRCTLKDFIEKLPNQFLQVHKSFCVNTKYITAINRTSVWLQKQEIPIGRSFLENIMKVLNIEI